MYVCDLEGFYLGLDLFDLRTISQYEKLCTFCKILALTLSTVVDILAIHVVWDVSRCCAVANALIQKFDVRSGDDAVRSRLPDEGHRSYLSPKTLATFSLVSVATPPQHLDALTCMYAKSTSDGSRNLACHRLRSDIHGMCWHEYAVRLLEHLTSRATSPGLVFT